MRDSKMKLRVVFYAEISGREPVREWLYCLGKDERKTIGYDIKLVQFGWPLGMPLVGSLSKGIWEVRSKLDTRIARVLFTAHSGQMVLLHGFIKKSQKTPPRDLELAKKRAQKFDKGDNEKE